VVAYVAQDHDAEVIYHGLIGTRQADIDQLIRKLSSEAQYLVCVDEAGSCGYRLHRSLKDAGLAPCPTDGKDAGGASTGTGVMVCTINRPDP
jgi:hypothetical protein